MTLVNVVHMVNRTLQRAVAEPDQEAETAVETAHASDPDTRLRDRALTGGQPAHIEDTDDEEDTTARLRESPHKRAG